jgi:hypothetical protein
VPVEVPVKVSRLLAPNLRNQLEFKVVHQMNILNQAQLSGNFNQNLGAMNSSISVLFYARKSRVTAKGLIPVYLRITLGGERFETSTKLYVQEDQTHDFMKWKYNMDDMNIKDLNYEFITGYEFWLKVRS